MVSSQCSSTYQQDLTILGAQKAAQEGGMIANGIDMSYLGVHSVWNNHIGKLFAELNREEVNDLVGLDVTRRHLGKTTPPTHIQCERAIGMINSRANRPEFKHIRTAFPQHRQLCRAIAGAPLSDAELETLLQQLQSQGQYTKAAAYALFEGVPKRAVGILEEGGSEFLVLRLALDYYLATEKSGGPSLDSGKWAKNLREHSNGVDDPYLRAIFAILTTRDWKCVVDPGYLPMKDRVSIALRYFEDEELRIWLESTVAAAIDQGDIEGVVLTGINESMVNIFVKYIERFADLQTALLVMSFCHPLYFDDFRVEQWREVYTHQLTTCQMHAERIPFNKESILKSKRRDGSTAIKPPPRQVTLRCINCDENIKTDATPTVDHMATTPTMNPVVNSHNRNPLMVSGRNSGIACPNCGRHLPRCTICLETLGMPRTKLVASSPFRERRLAQFVSYCSKCGHGNHMMELREWFKRHMECPVADCHCQCKASSQQGLFQG